MVNKFLIALFSIVLIVSCNGQIDVKGSSGSTSYSQTNLKNVAIYYGWLSSLNALGSNAAVINELNQYDIVVVGAGIQDAGHGDYANSTVIIGGLDSDVEVYGYITIGEPSAESIPTLQGKIDDWQTIGAEGVFIDEAGFDFWSGTDAAMRTRQNTIIDYIHGKGLKVFVNAWDPDDLFVKESGNPTTLNSSDSYLLESYIFQNPTPATSGTQTTTLSFTNHLNKIAKVNAAQASIGIKAYGVSTTGILSGSYNQSDFDFMAIAAQMDGLDGIGWGTFSFSGHGVDDAAVMPYRDIQSQYNNLKRTGSSTINKPAQTKYLPVLDTGTVEADYLNQTFSGI